MTCEHLTPIAQQRIYGTGVAPHASTGALLQHDLLDLAATLDDKLTVEEPLDGAGKPMKGRP